MTQEKGLDSTVADKIGQYVKLKGAGLKGEHLHPLAPLSQFLTRAPSEAPKLLEQLLQDSQLTSNRSAKEGLFDMSILFTLLRSYGILDKVCWDHELFP